MLQLTQRGQSPESIRIVDFQAINRGDMLRGPASKCDFVQTDITSASSVEAAFRKPWHSSVSKHPLTVFHTAAVIRPFERFPIFLDRSRRVNVGGTANVIDAARKSGSDIFIATSSAAVAVTPIRFWVWPWRSEPIDYVQIMNESDFDAPLRQPKRFIGNYGL